MQKNEVLEREKLDTCMLMTSDLKSRSTEDSPKRIELIFLPPSLTANDDDVGLNVLGCQVDIRDKL